jgi:hypothetical protein
MMLKKRFYHLKIVTKSVQEKEIIIETIDNNIVTITDTRAVKNTIRVDITREVHRDDMREIAETMIEEKINIMKDIK